jgi:DNA-binding XRE family transcriptional regulator
MLIMADLFKLGMNLLNQNPNPELHEKFFGVSGVHARLVFANRLHLGYSQEQLAKIADVGVTTVQRIEGGHPGVSAGKLQAVLDVLGITNKDIGEAFLEIDSLEHDSEKKPTSLKNKNQFVKA